MLECFIAAAFAAVGLDRRHTPSGSPLGAMPIVVEQGEVPGLLLKPLSEKEWWARHRALIARGPRTAREKLIAKRVDQIQREEEQRSASR